MKKFLFFCSLCILFSCSQNSIPKGIIAFDKMKIVLWQMLVSEQVANADTSSLVRLHLKDSVTYSFQKILRDNNISPNIYKKSIAYYESNPKLMQILLDSVNSYGNKISTAFQKNYKPKPIVPPAVHTPQSVPASNPKMMKPIRNFNQLHKPKPFSALPKKVE